MIFHKIPHPENLKSKPTPAEFRKLPKTPLVAILDNIRSLHNVGAMFRTADGARLEKIYLCGFTGCPPREQITKTALRTVEFVEWQYRKSALRLVRELKKKGYTIYALEQCHESKPYDEVKFKFPAALIVGHEIDGIQDKLLAEADEAIHLPMLGMANSLNVATAYGIAVYEMLRKLNFKEIVNLRF